MNRLSTPIRRQNQAEQIEKKCDPSPYCLQDTHFKFKDKNKLKVNRWENIPFKHQREERNNDYTYKNKIDFYGKNCYQRQGKTFYPLRRYSKYICT